MLAETYVEIDWGSKPSSNPVRMPYEDILRGFEKSSGKIDVLRRLL